jgi:hypothetical protein
VTVRVAWVPVVRAPRAVVRTLVCAVAEAKPVVRRADARAVAALRFVALRLRVAAPRVAAAERCPGV